MYADWFFSKLLLLQVVLVPYQEVTCLETHQTIWEWVEKEIWFWKIWSLAGLSKVDQFQWQLLGLFEESRIVKFLEQGLLLHIHILMLFGLIKIKNPKICSKHVLIFSSN